MKNKPHLFQPGQSGNPKGRPPDEDCWAGAIKKVMDSTEVNIVLTNEEGKEKRYHAISKKGTIKNAIIGMMTAKALNGDLKATDMIMDRLEGKPSQHVKVDGLDHNVLLEKLKDNEEDNIPVTID